MTDETKKKGKGFAAMDPERVREIARQGGKAAHASGAAHQFTSETAKIAGRRGGRAPHRSRGRGASVAPTAPVSEVRPTEGGDS